MTSKRSVKRRLIWAAVIGAVLVAFVIGIISFVEATSITEEAKRCAPNVWQSQWPRYIGCAMAAHEGLAGGVIGAAGALFAAWLAFTGIQEQLAAEAERTANQLAAEAERAAKQEAEAKISAVVCIAPSIHAAAEGLFAINNAINFRGNDTQQVDGLVKLAASHVSTEISRFVVQESLRGLSLDDRVVYLAIIGTLNVFVSINDRPSPILGRVPRLENQRDALMKLHFYLREFDAELAQIYARDSQTSPPHFGRSKPGSAPLT
jgi:hypothetical protein